MQSSSPSTRSQPQPQKRIIPYSLWGRLVASSSLTLGLVLLLARLQMPSYRPYSPSAPLPLLPPLVMQGGDPYLRALMRTISASESNDPSPYTVLYGGQRVQDLSHHPDRCVTIVTGPNTGNCTTAAGRYQFITTTWLEQARLYHPQPSQFLFWEVYSFEPEFQDQVMYRWLSDRHAWGADIPELLRQGELNQVLQLLSGTWTSLGYGIENNSMTQLLPEIYEKFLQQELSVAEN